MTGREPRVAVLDPAAWSPFYDHALCQALANEGVAVELVSSPFVHHPWPRPAGYARLDLFPAAAPSRPLRAASLGARLGRLRRGMLYPVAWRRFERRLEGHRPDAVHLQWSPLPFVDRRFLARLRARGIPLVVTVHNVAPHRDEPRSAAGAERILDFADRIVVHSTPAMAAISALARQRPDLQAKIHLVVPGIEPQLRPRSRAEARAVVGVPDAGAIVLLPGLLRAYKGAELLLDAFERLASRRPEVRLAIAGMPRPGSAIAERARRSPVAGRIVLDLGYLPRERFEAWLSAADVVALPYLAASPSAVAGAALAAGVPIVASRVDGLREWLEPEDEGARLFAPGDADGLVAALERVLDEPAPAAAAARARGAEALRRYPWSAAAVATAAIYRELAAAKRSEPQEATVSA